MEAANRGAFDTGVRSIGLNITLPREQHSKPFVTPELCFRFRYFALRKTHFLPRARARVAFPVGGPMFNMAGEVIGIVSHIFTRPGESSGPVAKAISDVSQF